jgi:hypothetical protein
MRTGDVMHEALLRQRIQLLEVDRPCRLLPRDRTKCPSLPLVYRHLESIFGPAVKRMVKAGLTLDRPTLAVFRRNIALADLDHGESYRIELVECDSEEGRVDSQTY